MLRLLQHVGCCHLQHVDGHKSHAFTTASYGTELGPDSLLIGFFVLIFLYILISGHVW